MRKLHAIFIFLTISQHSFLFGQKILWEQSLGGSHMELLSDVVATADYGFIMAGSSLSGQSGTHGTQNQGDFDYWIYKMDEDGDPVWQRSYGGNGTDLLKVIKRTLDGGLILGGTSTSEKSGDKESPNMGLEDFWVIKLNAAGEKEWEFGLGGLGQDYLQSIHVTQDGGYLIGGSSSSEETNLPFGKTTPHYGGLDYWVVKLDAKGKIEWQKSFGGKYNDELNDALEYEKGKYVLGGTTYSNISGSKTDKLEGTSDLWLIFLDENGNSTQQLSFGEENVSYQLQAMLLTKEGDLLLGSTKEIQNSNTVQSTTSSKNSFSVLKVSTEGVRIWEEVHQVSNRQELVSMHENNDGSILLSGYGIPDHTPQPQESIPKRKQEGEYDYVLIKLNAQGSELWQKILGSQGTDVLVKTIRTRDGGYLLSGTSNGSKSGDKQSNSQGLDYWIVKVLDQDLPIPDRYNGLEAFPNPTDAYSNVIITFDFETATARLFNLQGTMIHEVEVKDKTVPFDLSTLPAGIYLVEVQATVLVDNKKELRKASIKIMKGI